MTEKAILFLNVVHGDRVCEMTLAGIRRYGERMGWAIEPVAKADSAAGLRALLNKRRPLGCIVWNSAEGHFPSPRLFGHIPVVFVGNDPDSGNRGVTGAPHLEFDEVAVARAAFRELSSGRPDAYATVIFRQPRTWSLAREAAFRAFADAAGRPCLSFRGHWPKKEKTDVRAKRFAKWLAELPRKCAVFAINDDSAAEVAAAAQAAGRAIPQDLTLLGADNDLSICEASRPTISSLQMDFENVGFLAAKMLGETLRRSGTSAAAGTARQSHPSQLSRPTVTIGPLLAVRRESTRGRGRREPRILEAVEVIRRKACDGLTARALIDMFPGSRRLFELRFREATGHSVLDEIRHVRLQKAYALLAGTDVPIGAIPDFCGYDCASTLDKLFRAREHMSMQEWRRRHRL